MKQGGMSSSQTAMARKLALEFKEINDQTHPMLLKLTSTLKDSLVRLKLCLCPLLPFLCRRSYTPSSARRMVRFKRPVHAGGVGEAGGMGWHAHHTGAGAACTPVSPC